MDSFRLCGVGLKAGVGALAIVALVGGVAHLEVQRPQLRPRGRR
jgi:hypothetical protein